MGHRLAVGCQLEVQFGHGSSEADWIRLQQLGVCLDKFGGFRRG